MRLFGNGRSSTIDPQLKEALDGLVEHIHDSIEFSMMLSMCHPVWETADTFVAFCPGFDHVLIMMSDREAGKSDTAMIALTEEVLDDLENLLPLFQAHQDFRSAALRAREDAESTQLFAAARLAVNGELDEDGELPEAEKVNLEELRAAQESANRHLRSFMERHPHETPDAPEAS